MRPRLSANLVFLSLALTASAAMASAPTLPTYFSHAQLPPRLYASPLARPAATIAAGRWRNYGLLQTQNHAALYDPVRDRMICIGGDRDGAWELPLTGTLTWRELVHSPYQPWPVGWWATDYDAATNGLYFEAISVVDNTVVICRMDPETGSFEPLWADNAPPAITFMSMVHDRAHERIFVFGGQNLENFQLPDDVWVLDLRTRAWAHWKPAGVSPLGRIGGALIVDDARHRLLLLGGLANVSPGVWALDFEDTTWTQLSDQALPGDANPNGMLLDAAGERVLAFHRSGDVWAFSLLTNRWSILSISGPRPRGRLLAPLVMDTARHRLLVTGGLSDDESDLLNDAWALSLDGAPRWTPLVAEVARPQIRTAAGGAMDEARHRLVVFGGANQDGRMLQDTWALDLADTRWSAIPTPGAQPPGRAWPAMAYDPVRDRLVIFSGYGAPDTSEMYTDLWTLSLASGAPAWTEHAPADPKPSGRATANFVYDSPRDRFILLFGTDKHSLHDDVWELRFTPEPVWRRLSPAGPSPTRGGAMAVFDPARDRLLLFGGGGYGARFDDTWALDLSSSDGSWSQLPAPPGPSARGLGLLQMDTAHDRVLLFGGEEGTFLDFIFHNDVWALSLGGSPSWQEIVADGAPPSGRGRLVGAYDAVHDRLVLSGGGFFHPVNDTWGLEFGASAAPFELAVDAVDATPERVRVAWTSSQPGLSARLDRTVGDGDWQSVGTLVADAQGRIEYEDTDVSAGVFYRYRLAVNWGGEELLLGLASVTVPGHAMALAIGNPTTSVRFELELPTAGPAVLTVYDVAGRRVWARNVGALGPGKHDVTATDASWRSGVYFARLVQAGQLRAMRFAVLR